jgi:hypothetical protein
MVYEQSIGRQWRYCPSRYNTDLIPSDLFAALEVADVTSTLATQHRRGRSALHIAAHWSGQCRDIGRKQQWFDTCLQLMKAGADPHPKNDEEKTTFTCALECFKGSLADVASFVCFWHTLIKYYRKISAGVLGPRTWLRPAG